MSISRARCFTCNDNFERCVCMACVTNGDTFAARRAGMPAGASDRFDSSSRAHSASFADELWCVIADFTVLITGIRRTRRSAFTDRFRKNPSPAFVVAVSPT